MIETYMGIDPGIKGAIAFYRPRDKAVVVHDMPTFTKPNGKSEIDPAALFKLILPFRYSIKLALIEQVGAMTYVDNSGQKRGQGAAASFAFGKSTGIVVGMLGGLEIGLVSVVPAVWKSLMGVTRDKNTSLAKARTLFPKLESKLKRKMDDGRAEAALLAYFASERFS